MQSVLSRTKYESEQPSLPLFQKNKRNMDFNELLFREMSPFCISSASSNYVVVGFAGRAFDGTKEATHGGSQFYPVPITCRSSYLYHCFKQTKWISSPRVPGSLQASQHHEGIVLAHARHPHHGLEVHPDPPICTKQLVNSTPTNLCAVKTTNSIKVININFMVSNVI